MIDILNFVGGQWVPGNHSNDEGHLPEGTTAVVASRPQIDPNTNAPRVALPIPHELLTDEAEGECAAPWTVDRISPTIRCASLDQIESAISYARAGHRKESGTEATRSWYGPENLSTRVDAMLKLAQLLGDNEVLANALTLPDAFEVGVPRYVTLLVASGFAPVIRDTAEQCGRHLEEANAAVLRGPPLPAESANAALHQRLGGVKCRRMPHKVVAIVAPWNVPVGTVLPKVVAALVSGCSVIIKPSECAATSITLFARLLQKLRLPPTALQVLQGDSAIGHALVAHPMVNCVQFTGRAVTASRIACATAPRLAAFMAECGGSNAAVLLPGADIDAALPHITMGLCLLNGQWCMGISRIFVEERRCKELLTKLVAYLNDHVTLCPSHAFAPLFAADGSTSPTRRTHPLAEFGELDIDSPKRDGDYLVGPMAFVQHADFIRSLITRIGGTAITVGGIRHAAGTSPACFVQPTIIVDGDEAVTAKEELFSPVAAVHTYTTIQEAIDKVNRAPGQLVSYVFVHPSGLFEDAGGVYEDIEEIRFSLRAGMCMINSVGFGFEAGPDDAVMKGNGPHSSKAQIIPGMPPQIEFSGTAGFGRDGNGAVLAELFTMPRWSGIVGP